VSDTRVFVRGYKAYIRTIWTLGWAPYIKFIISQMYFVIYNWILYPLMMYITPLCSKYSISETYGNGWSSITRLILANIEYLYSFECEYSRISNTRIFAGYSRALRNHTRTNASIDIVAWTNTRIREYILVKHSTDVPPNKLWVNGLFSLYGRMTTSEPHKFLHVIYFVKIVFNMLYTSEFPTQH
jgi:hypothetical protein